MPPTVKVDVPETEETVNETRGFSNLSVSELQTYETFSGANRVLLPRPLYREMKIRKNFLFCSNCQRYTFMFNNTPIIVPCGHTFCEMCVKTEDGMNCKRCEISQGAIDICIENKSYKNLLQMYVNQGQDCMLDLVYQKYRNRINKRLQEICAHLPAWKQQRNKGRSFLMTLDFWSREIQIQESRAKNQHCPAFTIKKLHQISHLCCKADAVIKYQRDAWDSVIHEHKKGIAKDSNLLFNTNLNFPSVLKKMGNIYLEQDLLDEKQYFKLSSAQEKVHIHAGFRSSEVDENFEKENKIIMCTTSLHSFEKAFLEVSFYFNDEKVTGVVYFNLCELKNFSQAKVYSIFLGRWESLKGVKMRCENKNIIIPEPDPYNSIFDTPTTDTSSKTKSRLYTRSDVILHRVPTLQIWILTSDEQTSFKYKHQYIGELESGLNFLERGFCMAKEGIIENCGLVAHTVKEKSNTHKPRDQLESMQILRTMSI